MDWNTIVSNLISIFIPLIAGGAWLWARIEKKIESSEERAKERGNLFEKNINQKFENVNQKFEKIDRALEKIDVELKEIRRDISNLNLQVGKLETRVEERTLKVIHIEKTGTEEGKSHS